MTQTTEITTEQFLEDLFGDLDADIIFNTNGKSWKDSPQPYHQAQPTLHYYSDTGRSLNLVNPGDTGRQPETYQDLNFLTELITTPLYLSLICFYNFPKISIFRSGCDNEFNILQMRTQKEFYQNCQITNGVVKE
jgi:hypothetical protein